MINELELPVSYDWHVHLRDGEFTSVVEHTARQFAGAIVMPNLKNGHVTTLAEVRKYRTHIMSHVPEGCDFTPLMTISLRPEVSMDDFEEALLSGEVTAVKFYAGQTTNAEAQGDISQHAGKLSLMQDLGIRLLLHGESSPADDVFDREKNFYGVEGQWLVEKFTDLKVVCEHITTREAVNFVNNCGPNVAATITAHHLLANRNDMLSGGIRPHYYCLPILKRRKHQVALLEAATSGNPKFFLGTDSAPHAVGDKESACGCAGSFTAPTAIEQYAEAFDSVEKLSALDMFMRAGGEFYEIPPSKGSLLLRRTDPWSPPESLPFGEDKVVPFGHDRELHWKAGRVS